MGRTVTRAYRARLGRASRGRKVCSAMLAIHAFPFCRPNQQLLQSALAHSRALRMRRHAPPHPSGERPSPRRPRGCLGSWGIAASLAHNSNTQLSIDSKDNAPPHLGIFDDDPELAVVKLLAGCALLAGWHPGFPPNPSKTRKGAHGHAANTCFPQSG
jgi:hypothetical protein